MKIPRIRHGATYHVFGAFPYIDTPTQLPTQRPPSAGKARRSPQQQQLPCDVGPLAPHAIALSSPSPSSSPSRRANHRIKPLGAAAARGFLLLPNRTRAQEDTAGNARACGRAGGGGGGMGNCQAAEAAAVLVQHPGGGRTDRFYWALSADAVMAANPGHYVAAVITAPAAAGDPAATGGGAAAAPVKHLKLLRPDDTLLLGRVYRLVSFEEVLREFATKRQVKLSRVTIKAKDDHEGQEAARPAKPRRRRGRAERKESDTSPACRDAAAGERRESDRSLAKVMRQTDAAEPTAAAPPSGPGAAAAGHADEPADLERDLEALLPHGVVLGRRRFARQWRPALQSIAEG
ncbi:hypothetical protein ACP4OV_015332 [Aristida adscensionis]